MLAVAILTGGTALNFFHGLPMKAFPIGFLPSGDAETDFEVTKENPELPNLQKPRVLFFFQSAQLAFLDAVLQIQDLLLNSGDVHLDGLIVPLFLPREF